MHEALESYASASILQTLEMCDRVVGLRQILSLITPQREGLLSSDRLLGTDTRRRIVKIAGSVTCYSDSNTSRGRVELAVRCASNASILGKEIHLAVI